MLHHMKLYSGPFHAVRAGYKTVELRLYDEKRRQLQVGDEIVFSLTDAPEEQVQKTVTALHLFPDFRTLYKKLPLLQCGYTPANIHDARAEDMDAYYSREAQEAYGVVGIELEAVPFQKFLAGQEGVLPFCSGYQTALAEIRAGSKETHWMWYVFPQIKGLTNDIVTEYYALSRLEEARQYYRHPVLGARLSEIVQALLALKACDPVAVFGITDAYKLRSSMTLFQRAVPEEPAFEQVLNKFCLGTEDDKTMALAR